MIFNEIAYTFQNFGVPHIYHKYFAVNFGEHIIDGGKLYCDFKLLSSAQIHLRISKTTKSPYDRFVRNTHLCTPEALLQYKNGITIRAIIRCAMLGMTLLKCIPLKFDVWLTDEFLSNGWI